jgi:hypothetical protein
MTPRLRLIGAIVITIMFLSGCRNPFNPSTRESVNQVQAAAPTPETLLANLEEAYQSQDIDLFKRCLSPDFKFVLIASESAEIGSDMDKDGYRDNWWGYNEEVLYHENLFAHGSSDGRYAAPYHIKLDLYVPPRNTWRQSTEEGCEDALIITCAFDLVLSYTQTTDLASSGKATFYVRQEGSDWKILRWIDESNLY